MENRIKSIFGDYAENMQVLIDNSQEQFAQPFFPKYFNMGSPQVGLTYATAVGRSRIEPAASVVAHGSEAPLRGRPGLEHLSGEVAAIKVKKRMDESEYRNWIALENMPFAEEGRKSTLINLIWNDVKAVVDGVRSRLDIMCKQALSTGNVTINLGNNPDGIVVGAIDLLLANNTGNPGSRNGTTAAFGNTGTARWNEVTADVVADITTVVQNAEDNGVAYEKILMTPTQWRQVANRASTVLIFGQQPTLDEMNNYLVDRLLPYIELVTGNHSLETNGIVNPFVAWANQHVAFVPAGSAGIIHNTAAMEEFRPVTGVSYAINDRVLVSKWSQTEPFGEYTRGEIAAFPGLEIADSILIVNVHADAWA